MGCVLRADFLGFRIGLRYTGVWNSASLQTRDIADAMLSGVQKRKPSFAKL